MASLQILLSSGNGDRGHEPTKAVVNVPRVRKIEQMFHLPGFEPVTSSSRTGRLNPCAIRSEVGVGGERGAFARDGFMPVVRARGVHRGSPEAQATVGAAPCHLRACLCSLAIALMVYFLGIFIHQKEFFFFYELHHNNSYGREPVELHCFSFGMRNTYCLIFLPTRI
jgi:hypothetical protein